MKTGTYYGIDFGTTNTSVYLYSYDEDRGMLETHYGFDANSPFSSCIAISKIKPDTVEFGNKVKNKIYEYSENYKVVTSFKSMLGTDEEFVAGGRRYNGKELTSLFLNYVKESVRKECPDFKEAIFSIPVDFSPRARRDLLEAAEAVGIGVKGFISESSSAYISKVKEMKACSKVMVIDFGGGTLDISILNLRENQVHEDAVYGIKFGGDDIDKELAQRILPRVYPDSSFRELSSKQKDKLMTEVERMKIEFSQADDYDMILGEGSKPLYIDYETFSGIVTPLINGRVLPAILEAMKKASVSSESIDAVILAGGSSGLRPFALIVRKLFGADKIYFDEDNYQWMVAKGAAITSACDCQFRLSDDICILLSDDELYPILKKSENKVGDTSESLSFSLTEDSQDAHFIFTDSSGKNRYAVVSVSAKGFIDERFVLSVTVGRDQIAYVTIDNDFLGKDYGKKAELHELRFYYDLSGIEE